MHKITNEGGEITNTTEIQTTLTDPKYQQNWITWKK